MQTNEHCNRFGFSPVVLVFMLAMSGVLAAAFWPGLLSMVDMWSGREEYGHGFLIPLITLFLIWQKKELIVTQPLSGSWLGLLVTVAGVLLFLAGSLSSIYAVIQYAFVITLIGVIWSLVGWPVFRIIAIPLCLLFFMIPLPIFLYRGLSASLQLISSELGVAVIRLFDISVYLEGNVIDLGVYKLQVVEACSGLRYLFPLTSLAFMMAYIYKAVVWKRVLVFLSSIPITVLMNSFRIGAIGVLVEYYGIEQAEGFLHDFEGWVIFMACLGILLLEMWVLVRFGKDKKPFSEAFAIDLPPPAPADARRCYWKMPLPFLGSTLLVVLALVATYALGNRDEIIPERTAFSAFPVKIGNWEGRADVLESIYLDALKLDDYFIGDFVNKQYGAGNSVNFYVAYYASQRAGESAHSPRSCIPGGGWEIESLQEVTVPGVTFEGKPLRVNRLIIALGEIKQVVYYWFQQRGRDITNEYAVKWYLLEDAILEKRTDGALVRLTTAVRPGEAVSTAEARLNDFAKSVAPLLPHYIPN